MRLRSNRVAAAPAPPGADHAPILEARKLCCGYGQLSVLHDLDLVLHRGEVVALLGGNGAGKTTALLALAGELPAMSGEVLVDGRPTRAPLYARARGGLRFITEERSIFMGLTAAENLRLGSGPLERALDLFPELERLLKRKAGLLSGGEQQMLTMARALAADPVVLFADELSLGLAPQVVDRLLAAVRDAAHRGVAVLLVEQQVRQALTVADRAYVLQRGRVVLSGSASDVAARSRDIESSYLAAVPDERSAVDEVHQ